MVHVATLHVNLYAFLQIINEREIFLFFQKRVFKDSETTSVLKENILTCNWYTPVFYSPKKRVLSTRIIHSQPTQTLTPCTRLRWIQRNYIVIGLFN